MTATTAMRTRGAVRAARDFSDVAHSLAELATRAALHNTVCEAVDIARDLDGLARAISLGDADALDRAPGIIDVAAADLLGLADRIGRAKR